MLYIFTFSHFHEITRTFQSFLMRNIIDSENELFHSLSWILSSSLTRRKPNCQVNVEYSELTLKFPFCNSHQQCLEMSKMKRCRTGIQCPPKVRPSSREQVGLVPVYSCHGLAFFCFIFSTMLLGGSDRLDSDGDSSRGRFSCCHSHVPPHRTDSAWQCVQKDWQNMSLQRCRVPHRRAGRIAECWVGLTSERLASRCPSWRDPKHQHSPNLVRRWTVR